MVPFWAFHSSGTRPLTRKVQRSVRYSFSWFEMKYTSASFVERWM